METSSSSFHFPDRLAKEREHHYHFIFQTNSTLQSVSDIRVFDVPDLSVFDVAVIPGIIVGLAVGLYTDGYGNDSLWVQCNTLQDNSALLIPKKHRPDITVLVE